MQARVGAALAAVLAAMVLAGCGEDAAVDKTTKQADEKSLDAIAVIGHSGATGEMSDPERPDGDAPENSWATGDNPEVDSIYLRLLKDHPALKGHNYNRAVDGSFAVDLEAQFEGLRFEKPLPDVVIIQTIDNDIRCDGSDADNYAPFGETLDNVLTYMAKTIPDVQFFFVSQWGTVQTSTALAAQYFGQVTENSSPGPCQLFKPDGTVRPAGVRTLQRIVDSYWAQVVKVCAAHPGCYTDGGAEQKLVPTAQDLVSDGNHLSVAGHEKFAAIAWDALPDEIKQRP
jgi:lysophospholipase L1-like esterase